jgi:hypothetical protein
MIWNIHIKRNAQIKRFFDAEVKGPDANRNYYFQLLNRFIVRRIKQHISNNQYRFNKTRKRFGISGARTNYIPSNVYQGKSSYPTVKVDVRIKGIERNFRPLVILPKSRKYLTIPVSRESYGKSAWEFDLFKPKGKNVLAKKTKSKKLEILYALSRQVYQPMEKGMLPDERQLLSNAYIDLVKYINEQY